MLHYLLISLACGNHAHLLAAPDVAAEVHRESKEMVEIHDVFNDLEQADVKEEKVVKKNKNLAAALVQIGSVTSPKDNKTKKDKKKDPIAEKVKAEKNQEIHIHDEFASLEKADVQAEMEVRGNHSLQALLQKPAAPAATPTPAPRRVDIVAKEVRQEAEQNLQIHDEFAMKEKSDKKQEKQIHADRDLSAFQSEVIDDNSDDTDAMSKYLGVPEFHVTTDSPPQKVHKHSRPNVEDGMLPGASSESQGEGIVATVPLSSQLQQGQSLLQKNSLRGKTTPNVEKRVANEMMEDEFRSLEKNDKVFENTVYGDPN